MPRRRKTSLARLRRARKAPWSAGIGCARRIPMSRGVFVATGVLAIALGLFIAFGPQPASPAPHAAAPTATVAAVSSTATTLAPSPTPLPPIPPGYRVQIPRLGIDLAIVEGDIERDAVLLRTPENFAFHLPGPAIPGDGLNSYLYAHARLGMFVALWNERVGDAVGL